MLKVICPIDPEQDANSYYQRLNTRGSLDIYTDITAGLNAMNLQAY